MKRNSRLEVVDTVEKYFSKIKNQKGITLIALVITVIILLMLVGITISQLTKGGILDKAKQSKEKTKVVEELENTRLSQYEQQINGYISGTRANENNTILFDTLISTNKSGEDKLITLNDNIEKYRFIIVQVAWNYGAKDGSEKSQYFFDTDLIEIQEDVTNMKYDNVITYGYSDSRKNLGLCFLKDNKLSIYFDVASSGGVPVALTKILGVK